MRTPNKDNWLEITMNALEELENEWSLELTEYNPEPKRKEELEGKLEELEALIKYLNKTN